MSSSIFYDEERNIYIDLNTGEEIPAANSENFTFAGSYPPKENNPTGFSDFHEHDTTASPTREQSSITQVESDHLLALRLAANEGQPRASRSPKTSTDLSRNQSRPPVENELTIQTMNLNLSRDMDENAPPPGWGWEDWSLARALQSMEIEIANEINEGAEFESVERNAMSWKNQLFTSSAFICFVQVVVMIGMWIDGGVASQTENPMIGPPAVVLVRWGAKEMSLMVYDGQWWRLISPIGLHAGLWHILSNVFIQLRVGGYLNLLWGTPQFLCIYFVSGVFGYMLSGIFSVDTVGIGSSGAILGMLTAWAVWIIFRWNKVPAMYHKQRNCQLGTVVVAVLVTLGLSFTPYVDWAAHVGGAIQGILWGAIVLSNELENNIQKWAVRIIAFSISVISFGLAAAKLPTMNPNHALLEYFDANDDWGKRF